MTILSKTLLLLLILALFVLYSVQADEMATTGIDVDVKSLPRKIDCGVACSGRCRLSSRPRLCKRACGTCCARCQCVPPGTYGHQDVCLCYFRLTTHGGRRKCP